MKTDNRRTSENLNRVEKYLAEIKKMIVTEYDNIIFEEYQKNNLIFINADTNESVKVDVKKVIANNKNIDINYIKNYIKNIVKQIESEVDVEDDNINVAKNELEQYLNQENLKYFYDDDDNTIHITINETSTLILTNNDYSILEIKEIIETYKHKIRKK